MSIAKTLTWLVLIGWIAGGTYWHVCQIKQLCDGNPKPLTKTESSEAFISPALDIQDGSHFHVTSENNLSFGRSNGRVVTGAVEPQLQALAGYLKQNPKKILTVTGFYSSIEENNTSFPTLGQARADAIRQYFVKAGVPQPQVRIDAKQLDLAFSPADSIYGAGFAFAGATELPNTVAETSLAEPAVSEPATPESPEPAPVLRAPKGQTEEELAAAATYEGIFKPMDLYFPLSSNQFIRTKDNDKFFEEAKKYLKQHPDKRLTLIGHTDSEGPDDHNLRLSKSRAEAVKKQFIRKGIKSEQLVTDGKGETQPIADNALPAGRKANRRVTIVVQEQKM
ncbi:OmpA family protein [Siphonobacter curvatus]|uniref:Flagellar motor protein MotB n=1 Tax=Siphonobacter curvatus TaxID=2094562 RepID=A0A2S7IP62_9BACT|nr:OmpA family protein [Siphonobacter curvatus]PQA59482.1 flagellar motor protein MotB [Siphonobacter curvatus]